MSENRRQAELAKETLQVFADHGEDFSETRHVIHYFYGGNFAGLAAALGELGYSVRPTVGNDGVVAERCEVIGEEWRTNILIALCDMADTYGVEYDGWEAVMTRQQAEPEPDKTSAGGLFSRIFGKKN